MINAPLQGLFIQPRRGPDPRVAKTDETSLAVGSDGILYKMVEQRDWEKYRTLTDYELREELNKSREIKENMYTLNGKLKNNKYGQSSSKIKLVAPQFGTQSRSRKIEKRNWEQDLNTLKNSGENASMLKTNSDYHKTMATLVQNQQINDGTLKEIVEPPWRPPAQFRPESGGLNVTQSAEDRIHAAINIMKDKYEQNLHVVEQLFDEKKYMERKIQLLEDRLRRKVHREGPEFDDQDVVDEDQYEPQEEGEDEMGLDDPRLYATYDAPPSYDDLTHEHPVAGGVRGSRQLKHSDYEPEGNRSGYNQHVAARGPTRAPARASASVRSSRVAENPDGEYSAAELATMLNSPGESTTLPPKGRYHASTERSQSAPSRRRAPVADSTDSADLLRQSRSTHRASRPSSASAERDRSSGARSSTPVGMRSSSVGSRGSISANLQADADRYIQKRRMLEEQEKSKRLEDERYEQQLRERYLKASMNGKEFTEMRKRQEAAEQQNKLRRDKFLQKQQDDEEALRRERRAKLEANKQSMTMVTKNQLTWRELQEIEEAKRRDRIERRKQELAQISALPSSIAENLQKTRREAPVDTRAVSVGEFKAEDPSKVAAKLAHAQKIWDLKMERERQKIKERHDTKILAATAHLSSGGDGESGAGNYLGKSAMEIRTEQYARKREAKLRDKKEREEQEAKLQRELEEKKREKLLNTKVPIGKPTNAAILKAEKVQKDKQKEQDEERRMRAMARKKEIASKEASAVLSVIIAERENELRGSRGGHLELRSTQQQKDAAAAAREQYREQQRANKKRIEDSLQNRKSLIERHDTSIATKNAEQVALQKFAGAVGIGGGSNRGSARSSNHGSRHNSGSGKAGAGEHSFDNLDLFDAKEQIRLGLKAL